MTREQKIAIDALQIVAGLEEWRFDTSNPDVIISSNHDVRYVLNGNGDIAAIDERPRFPSRVKAINFYSRPVPAWSTRDIAKEVDDMIAAGTIVVEKP